MIAKQPEITASGHRCCRHLRNGVILGQTDLFIAIAVKQILQFIIVVLKRWEMTQPDHVDRFISLAKIAAGDEPGWQARFADLSGLSPALVSHYANRRRGLPTDIEQRIAVALQQGIKRRMNQVQVMKRTLDLLTDEPTREAPVQSKPYLVAWLDYLADLGPEPDPKDYPQNGPL